MAGISGLLFDKDGTLFDFEATWGVWAHGRVLTLAEGDVGRAAALGEVIGYDYVGARFARDSIVIAGTVTEVAARLLPHLPGRELNDLVVEFNAAARDVPQVPAVPLPQCLGDLRGRGLRLGIATNDAESSAWAHLRKAGVEEMFDYVAGYDSGYGAKPGPGPLNAFALKMGLAPDAVAMIGDSLHDMAAARAAGMRAVGVLTGPAMREDLAPAADVVLADIGELADWLDAGAP